VIVGDLGDDVGEVELRIDITEFAGLDEGRDDRPMLTAAIGAGEQRILPVQCYRPDATLDDIGVDVDTTIIDEAGEAFPA